MFCPNCGAQVSGDAKFCPQCGCSLTKGGFTTSSAGSTHAPESVASPIRPSVFQQKLAQAQREGLGMGWYKFTIYVHCFFSALLTFINGASGLMLVSQTGNANPNVALTLEHLPDFRFAAILFSVLSIVLGILYIYARHGMRKFRTRSTNLYVFLPLTRMTITLTFCVACFFMLNQFLDSMNVSWSTLLPRLPSDTIDGLVKGIAIFSIANIGLFAINLVYFRRRSHLFNET